MKPALAVALFMCCRCGFAATVIRDVTVISPERSEPLERLTGDVQINGRGKVLISGFNR
jgi:hypothetical protein